MHLSWSSWNHWNTNILHRWWLHRTPSQSHIRFDRFLATLVHQIKQHADTVLWLPLLSPQLTTDDTLIQQAGKLLKKCKMAPHNDDHNINAANMIFWHCMKKTNPLTHKRNQNGSIKFGGNTNTSTLEQFCQDVKRIPTSLTINTWRWANKSNPETARQWHDWTTKGHLLSCLRKWASNGT